MGKKINRIRVVLAEQNKKNIWLADKMQKNPLTISLFCNNERQPTLETLVEVANILGVDARQLINPTK